MNWTIHQKIDLKGRYKQHFTMDDVLLIPGNNQGHVWEVEVVENGEAVDLSGYTCNGRFVRENGSVISITGTISMNVAKVKFSDGCYVVPGQLRGVVTLTKDNNHVSVCETYFIVRETLNANGTIIIPSDEIVYIPPTTIEYDNKKFINTNDTTATKEDVRSGKIFYNSNGDRCVGEGDFSVTFGSGVSVVDLGNGDYKFVYS